MISLPPCNAIAIPPCSRVQCSISISVQRASCLFPIFTEDLEKKQKYLHQQPIHHKKKHNRKKDKKMYTYILHCYCNAPAQLNPFRSFFLVVVLCWIIFHSFFLLFLCVLLRVVVGRTELFSLFI